MFVPKSFPENPAMPRQRLTLPRIAAFKPEGEGFFTAPAAVASDVLGATSSRNAPRSRFRSTVTTSFRAANASEEGEE